MSQRILLGSKSPRRRELLSAVGIQYEIADIDCDEDFPADMAHELVAAFLAEKKSIAFTGNLENSILITADTIVSIGNEILNKPENLEEAKLMLGKLSGHKHIVYTGVCIRNSVHKVVFTDATNVYFKPLAESDIEYYVNTFKPFDKAGSYGIQDWMGYTNISGIEGDYYNVMGLPINKVYEALQQF